VHSLHAVHHLSMVCFPDLVLAKRRKCDWSQNHSMDQMNAPVRSSAHRRHREVAMPQLRVQMLHALARSPKELDPFTQHCDISKWRHLVQQRGIGKLRYGHTHFPYLALEKRGSDVPRRQKRERAAVPSMVSNTMHIVEICFTFGGQRAAKAP
jgi:hypothetical protein